MTALHMAGRHAPRLPRWLDGVTMAANVVGSLLIFALVLLIFGDVMGRNLLNAPISGVPEMVSLSIVAIVFLQAPMALKAGRMTRSDGAALCRRRDLVRRAAVRGCTDLARGADHRADRAGAGRHLPRLLHPGRGAPSRRWPSALPRAR